MIIFLKTIHDTIFEVVVPILCDMQLKQAILIIKELGALNVMVVLILYEGFELASFDLISCKDERKDM